MQRMPADRWGGHSHIHVEQAIRLLNVYKILFRAVAVSLAPEIDKTLKICAGLVNLILHFKTHMVHPVNLFKNWNEAQLIHNIHVLTVYSTCFEAPSNEK